MSEAELASDSPVEPEALTAAKLPADGRDVRPNLSLWLLSLVLRVYPSAVRIQVEKAHFEWRAWSWIRAGLRSAALR